MSRLDPNLFPHIPPLSRWLLIELAYLRHGCPKIGKWYQEIQQALLNHEAHNHHHLRPDIDAHDDLTHSQDVDHHDTHTLSSTASGPTQPLTERPNISASADGETSSRENPTPAPDETKPFCCPVCKRGSAHYRALVRHVDQRCLQTREWRCPESDCDAKFKRAIRFRKHHRVAHAYCAQDSSPDCAHEDLALTLLPPKRALGCGFCRKCFESDQRGFLQHLGRHYTDGYRMRDWRITKQVLGLLKRQEVNPTWVEVTQYTDLSQLDWNPEDVKPFISILEGDVTTQDLELELRRLLTLGLPHRQVVSFAPVHAGAAPTVNHRMQPLNSDLHCNQWTSEDPTLRTLFHQGQVFGGAVGLDAPSWSSTDDLSSDALAKKTTTSSQGMAPPLEQAIVSYHPVPGQVPPYYVNPSHIFGNAGAEFDFTKGNTIAEGSNDNDAISAHDATPALPTLGDGDGLEPSILAASSQVACEPATTESGMLVFSMTSAHVDAPPYHPGDGSEHPAKRQCLMSQTQEWEKTIDPRLRSSSSADAVNHPFDI